VWLRKFAYKGCRCAGWSQLQTSRGRPEAPSALSATLRHFRRVRCRASFGLLLVAAENSTWSPTLRSRRRDNRSMGTHHQPTRSPPLFTNSISQGHGEEPSLGQSSRSIDWSSRLRVLSSRISASMSATRFSSSCWVCPQGQAPRSRMSSSSLMSPSLSPSVWAPRMKCRRSRAAPSYLAVTAVRPSRFREQAFFFVVADRVRRTPAFSARSETLKCTLQRLDPGVQSKVKSTFRVLLTDLRADIGPPKAFAITKPLMPARASWLGP
jgi:hypothetical protein